MIDNLMMSAIFQSNKRSALVLVVALVGILSGNASAVTVKNEGSSAIGVVSHVYNSRANLNSASATNPGYFGESYNSVSIGPLKIGQTKTILNSSTSLPEGSHICIFAGGVVPEYFSHTTEAFIQKKGTSLYYTHSSNGVWRFTFRPENRSYGYKGWTSAKQGVKGKASLTTVYCTRDRNHQFVLNW